MTDKKNSIMTLLDFLQDKRALCGVIKILIKTNLLDDQQVSGIEKMILEAWHTAATKREKSMLQKTLQEMKNIQNKEKSVRWKKSSDERLQNELQHI